MCIQYSKKKILKKNFNLKKNFKFKNFNLKIFFGYKNKRLKYEVEKVATWQHFLISDNYRHTLF